MVNVEAWKLRTALLTWALLVALAPAAGAQEIEATCLLLSGVPVPSVSISDPMVIAQLRSDLEGLTEIDEPVWPDAGWRGVQLRNFGVSSFPDMVRVFEGAVRIYDGGEVRNFNDDNGVEPDLSDLACAALGPTSTIPTLSLPALVAFVGLLAGAMYFFIRRRNLAVQAQSRGLPRDGAT